LHYCFFALWPALFGGCVGPIFGPLALQKADQLEDSDPSGRKHSKCVEVRGTERSGEFTRGSPTPHFQKITIAKRGRWICFSDEKEKKPYRAKPQA